jgi:hypothetical protein
MQQSMGLAAETLHQGTAGVLSRLGKTLAAAGAAVAATVDALSLARVPAPGTRLASAVAGAALLAGSACTRFAIFHAGQDSARDPKYTVVPQRDRLNARS